LKENKGLTANSRHLSLVIPGLVLRISDRQVVLRC